MTSFPEPTTWNGSDYSPWPDVEEEAPEPPQYSEAVDDAIEALPTVEHPVPGQPHARSVKCPVLETEDEAKLMILAIADQADLGSKVTDALAKTLGVEPLKPLGP